MTTNKDIVEFYKDKKGQYWWRRISSNGNIVGGSTEGYKSTGACKRNYERHYIRPKKTVINWGKK